jgi:hypothetical protein
MSARPLVIITTRLAPQICGVGAYSWLLHEHWPGERDRVRFLVVDGAAQSSKSLNHSAITEFNSKPGTLARELDRIGAADVLLHYAGRSFQRFGCPWWLPSVLKKWKEKFSSGRLMILCHELPGNLPFASRHYWINMCNRRVIRKLAKVADVLVTNTSDHAEKLAKISGRADVHWFPVPSNIAAANASETRLRTEFVIFGLPFGRWQTLQMYEAEIRSWHDRGLLTKLHLVGPHDAKFDVRSDELIERWHNPGVVVRHGLLSPVEVSNVLGKAQFGLTNATAGNWSKSAVLMAFASHACPVVSKTKSEVEPLRFMIAPDEVATIEDVDLDQRARSLQEWYRTHASWDVIAKKISALLPENSGEEAAA